MTGPSRYLDGGLANHLARLCSQVLRVDFLPYGDLAGGPWEWGAPLFVTSATSQVRARFTKASRASSSRAVLAQRRHISALRTNSSGSSSIGKSPSCKQWRINGRQHSMALLKIDHPDSRNVTDLNMTNLIAVSIGIVLVLWTIAGYDFT